MSARPASNQKTARKRAVEMPGLWKAWKAQSDFPLFPRVPWKSRPRQARFPHSHSSESSFYMGPKNAHAGGRYAPAKESKSNCR